MGISAHSPSVSVDATSEWEENSTQSPSISVDATSEWEAPFSSVQRGAGVEKPQNTAPGTPGQELRKQRTGETGGREEIDEKSNCKL